jgi:hypothetical protein
MVATTRNNNLSYERYMGEVYQNSIDQVNSPDLTPFDMRQLNKEPALVKRI